MNLDALYSELTLKTNAKLALIVLDGVGDVATREQGYLTPLEAAATPNGDGRFIKEVNLTEISLVQYPANPRANVIGIVEKSK